MSVERKAARSTHLLQEFDASKALLGRLFDSAIEVDPWVVFHGTSVANCTDIETVGFSFASHPLEFQTLQKLLGVFERMKWKGGDGGGYAVLASFSSNDFVGQSPNSTYFAVESVRALLYATREMAGGEKLRAVRRAIRDLRLYLDDAGTRESHLEKLEVEYEYLAGLNASPEMLKAKRPEVVDLHWLEGVIAEFAHLETESERVLRVFAGGAVYAVRLFIEDLDRLTLLSSLAIAARGNIPSDRIVARVDIPREIEWDPIWQQHRENRFDSFVNGQLWKSLDHQRVVTR